MEFTYAATGAFSASHEEEACFIGPRLHGHRWTVSTRTQARFDPVKGRLTSGTHIGISLNDLLAELDGRHLNDMLPGTHTTPENIGAWAMERLSLSHKGLFEVTVEVDGHEVRITREVRA